MNQRLTIGLIAMALILVSAILLLRRMEPSAVPTSSEAPLPSVSGVSEGVPQSVLPPSPSSAETVADWRQRVVDLGLALDAAVDAREQAVLRLDKSDEAVTELEVFIEDIEARGEDPADYAEEGLERFQPAFDEYQRALSALENAEEIEQALRKELAEAQRELAMRSGNNQ